MKHYRSSAAPTTKNVSVHARSASHGLARVNARSGGQLQDRTDVSAVTQRRGDIRFGNQPSGQSVGRDPPEMAAVHLIVRQIGDRPGWGGDRKPVVDGP